LLDIGGGFPGWDGEGRFSGRTRKRRKRRDEEHHVSTSTTPSGHDSTVTAAAAIFCHRHSSPSFKLQALWQERPQLPIIAEPGRYFVEASAGLVSQSQLQGMVVQQY